MSKAPGPAQPADPPTFSLVNLGCPKNLVDSENILGQLVSEGFLLCADPADAELILVNTCGFIDAAREESLGTLREMAELKKDGECKALVAVGCMAQRFSKEIAEAVPQVDGILGLAEYAKLPAVCRDLLATKRRNGAEVQVSPPTRSCRPDTGRLRITPRHYAYLKISEGCNHTCTFCAIPKIRGAYRSKSAEDCLAETLELVSSGVRELNLVAEDSTFWGREWHGRVTLERLLEELDRKAYGLEWIRILYAHPIHVTERLVLAMASLPKVARYVDIPIQHGSSAVLKRMMRGYDQDRVRRVVGMFREAMPEIFLRTTIIVGSPGETDEEVDELLRFLEEVRFERLGCFVYSPEHGTPMAEHEGRIAEELAEERRDRVMSLQQGIALAHGEGLVGKTLSCIVDRENDEGEEEVGRAWIGRSYGDAPDIDGLVEIRGEDLAPGDIVDVLVEFSRGYDLAGTAVGEPR